jgi:lysophospholipase L1-like esterase
MKLRFISALLLISISLCGYGQQVPAGYLRKGLREGRDLIAQRADTYAEMLTMKNPGIPKQFVVETDEVSGQTNVVYYWDGFELHGSVAPAINASQINTALGYTAADNTAVLNLKKLPVDSKIVYIGDSITQHGFTANGTNYFYQGAGYPTHANIAAGHKYYYPIGGNKGVSGERTDQVIARLGAILAMRPKMAVVLLGSNDTGQSVSEAVIENNLNIIYKALLSIGCKVIAITIPPRYAPSDLLSTANEATRANVNAWILANKDLTGTVNAETILTSASYFADGLHPNAQGSYLLGKSVGQLLAAEIEDVSASYQISPEGVNNYSLAGGTTLASSFSTQQFTGGATLTPSKSVVNGQNQQLFTISGNYTGNGKGFNVVQDYVTSFYQQGDIIEGILDIEILSPMVNINAIRPKITVHTAGYATQLGYTEGYYPDAAVLSYYPVGRYTIKTPPMQLNGGVPAIVVTTFGVSFVDASTTLPVSAQFKIHRIGSRKVPTSQELDLYLNKFPQPSSLPVYSDNASAAAGNVAIGAYYRTPTGVIMTRY